MRRHIVSLRIQCVISGLLLLKRMPAFRVPGNGCRVLSGQVDSLQSPERERRHKQDQLGMVLTSEGILQDDRTVR